MTDPKIAETLWAVAREAADAARDAILPHFRARDLLADNKDEAGGFDPVTIADKAGEDAIRKVLAAHRPMDGIIGEERGRQAASSEFTWILDPIDGTRAFLAGAPTWGTLIAVFQNGDPILGLIDQPYIGERFEGGLGRATLDHSGQIQALKCRSEPKLSGAVLTSTFPEIGTEAERQAFERVRDQMKLTRYGLDCYGYALVAAGHIDLVIEAGLNLYDIAAPMAVVQAAGGVFTDWQGNPVRDGGQVIAAGNAELHAAALQLLNSG